MGILSDFFVGNDELAKGIEDTSSIPSDDKLEARNVMDLYLGFLYQISEGKETSFDNSLGFKTLNFVDGGERITTKIPDKFVSILGKANDQDIEKWSIEWAKQEELMWPEDDAIKFVKDLRSLFQKGISSNRSVYLWNCV